MDELLSNPNPWILTICGGVVVAIVSALLLQWLGLQKSLSEEKGAEETKTGIETKTGFGPIGCLVPGIAYAIWLSIPTLLLPLQDGFDSWLIRTQTQFGLSDLTTNLLSWVPPAIWIISGAIVVVYLYERFKP